ncbi:MAG: phytanoyl-CoA dioxygenase family protein [Candidatus Latescibacteria bacterium]|nr:phytanoyl-CoA dioxygenase family protein [Candidatus Latescibacterota bacterium]
MLSEQQLEQFHRNGYVRLGQVATDEEIDGLRVRIDDIMMGRIRYDGMFFQLDSETGVYADVKGGGNQFLGPSINYRKIERLELDDRFLRYVQHPHVQEITEQLIGPHISVFRCMFMNKPPKRGTVLPYHQDGGSSWNLTIDPILTVWTALDEATKENGCMQIIPGSHKLGLLSERGHTISAEHGAQYAKDEDSIFLEAKVGEVFVLHNWLLHRSGVNTIERPRRAFSVCYMDAATRSTRNGQGFPVVFGHGALKAA